MYNPQTGLLETKLMSMLTRFCLFSYKVMCERTLHVPAAKSLSQPVGIKWNHTCSINSFRCTPTSYDIYKLVAVPSLALILPRHTISELVPNVSPQQPLVVNPCRGVTNCSKLASPSLVPRRAIITRDL